MANVNISSVPPFGCWTTCWCACGRSQATALCDNFFEFLSLKQRFCAAVLVLLSSVGVQVAVIVDGVTKKAAEIATVKDDAERDLAAAKPALDAALTALNSITQKDIVGLKALKNPPDIVKRIFDCVLLLR